MIDLLGEGGEGEGQERKIGNQSMNARRGVRSDGASASQTRIFSFSLLFILFPLLPSNLSAEEEEKSQVSHVSREFCLRPPARRRRGGKATEEEEEEEEEGTNGRPLLPKAGFL